MLERSEVVLVVNHRVIVVVRKEHTHERRVRDEVAVTVEQLAVGFAVIEVVVVESRAVVVIKDADPVADRLVNVERGVERDVAAFAVPADDQIALELRRDVLEVLHSEGIGLHPVVQIEVEVLVPAGDGIVRAAIDDDRRPVGEQERRRAELQSRELLERALAADDFQLREPLGLRHAHQVDAGLLREHQTEPPVLAALRLEIGVCRVGKGHRLRADVRLDDRLERQIDDLTQREVVRVGKRAFRERGFAEFTDIFVYACHRDPSRIILTIY